MPATGSTPDNPHDRGSKESRSGASGDPGYGLRDLAEDAEFEIKSPTEVPDSSTALESDGLVVVTDQVRRRELALSRAATFSSVFSGGDSGLTIVAVGSDNDLVATLAETLVFKVKLDPTRAVQEAFINLENGDPDEADRAAKDLALGFKQLMRDQWPFAPHYLALVANHVQQKASESERYAILFEHFDNLLALFDPNLKDASRGLRTGNSQIRQSNFDLLFRRLVTEAAGILEEDPNAPGRSSLLSLIILKQFVATLRNTEPEVDIRRHAVKQVAHQLFHEIEQVRLQREVRNRPPLVELLDRSGEVGKQFFAVVLDNVTSIENYAVSVGRGHIDRRIDPLDAENTLACACLLPRTGFFERLASLVEQQALPAEMRLLFLSAMKYGLRLNPAAGDLAQADFVRQTQYVIEKSLELLKGNNLTIARSTCVRVLDQLALPTFGILAADNMKLYNELPSSARQLLLTSVLPAAAEQQPQLAGELSRFALHEVSLKSSFATESVVLSKLLPQGALPSLTDSERDNLLDFCIERLAALDPENPAVGTFQEILAKIGIHAVARVMREADSTTGREHASIFVPLAAKLIAGLKAPAPDSMEATEHARLVEEIVLRRLVPNYRTALGNRKSVIQALDAQVARLKQVNERRESLDVEIQKAEEQVAKINESTQYSAQIARIATFRGRYQEAAKRAESLKVSDPAEAGKAQNAADGIAGTIRTALNFPIIGLGMTVGEAEAVLAEQKTRLDKRSLCESVKSDILATISSEQLKLTESVGRLSEESLKLIDLLTAAGTPKGLVNRVYGGLRRTEIPTALLAYGIALYYRHEVDDAERALLVTMKQTRERWQLRPEYVSALRTLSDFVDRQFFARQSALRQPLVDAVWQNLRRHASEVSGFIEPPIGDDGGHESRLTREVHEASLDFLCGLLRTIPANQREPVERILRFVIKRYSMSFDPTLQMTLGIETAFSAVRTYAEHGQHEGIHPSVDHRKLLRGYFDLAVRVYEGRADLKAPQITRFILPALKAMEDRIPLTAYVARTSEGQGEGEGDLAPRENVRGMLRSTIVALERMVAPPTTQPPVKNASGQYAALTFQFDPTAGVPALGAPISEGGTGRITDDRRRPSK